LVHTLKGETKVIEDVAASEDIQYRKETLKEGVVSMLCVPIKSKDEIIGVLRLYSDVKRGFPEDTIMLVNAIAHQGGLAIQNASMHMMLQEDKKSLEQEIWSHRMWF
jgi:GAF domain-containing protein